MDSNSIQWKRSIMIIHMWNDYHSFVNFCSVIFPEFGVDLYLFRCQTTFLLLGLWCQEYVQLCCVHIHWSQILQFKIHWFRLQCLYYGCVCVFVGGYVGVCYVQSVSMCICMYSFVCVCICVCVCVCVCVAWTWPISHFLIWLIVCFCFAFSFKG